MDVVWLGHSCFRLRGRSASVVTDPFERTSLGYPSYKVAADVVTVSREEPHHNHSAGVTGSPRRVAGPGEYEVRGVTISGVLTNRARKPQQGALANTAFVIEIDDIVCCHLGDLDEVLGVDQISRLKEPDLLFVPVGGHCTIDATKAAEVVSQLEPKLVVPMHYQVDGVRVPLDPVERFCREMAADVGSPQARLSVTRGSLPEETTVVLLSHVHSTQG